MTERKLSLSGRCEDVWEKIIVPVMSFNRDQIKEHFDADVAAIESYCEIADIKNLVSAIHEQISIKDAES